MSETTPRVVNCTQCAAPLDLNGGHRVRSLSCGFCGAVLDAREEYKVVKQFANMQRPPMPLELGAKGTLKDVEFTIIGVVQYRDREGYQWLEYQVFSPTHGYHWLNFTNGHFVFSRRVREMPRMNEKQKATFKAKGHTFKVYESYVAEIIFVEGELTYVASVGDGVEVIEGISPPYNFSRERSGTEEEYQMGEYIDHEEVYAAFGVETPPQPPAGIHGAQPYTPNPNAVSVSRMGRWFAIPALLIAVGILVFGGGTERMNGFINAADFVKGTETKEFLVEDSNSLVSLQLFSNLNNAWAWYDIAVVKGDQTIARLGKQLSYYHGVSGGESWSEGSQSTKAYFKLPEAGKYKLFIKGTGGVGNQQGVPQNQPLHLILNEGVIISRYFFLLAAIAIIAALWQPWTRHRFEAKRWAAVEEDDDDE